MLAETLPWLWTSLEFLLAGDWPEEEEAYQVCTLVHVWGLHWVIHSCSNQSLQVVLASQCSSGLRFNIFGHHFHGLGVSLLKTAREIARWWLGTWPSLVLEEAEVFLKCSSMSNFSLKEYF